jgi:hypothetical protein
VEIYRTKIAKLAGTDYHEVARKARRVYKDIASKSKRKPYIRSAYFKKEKVFLDYFWQHLQEKNWHDRFRRLQFYSCALDLIRNSHVAPVTVKNPNKSSEKLHRFHGGTRGKEIFVVQIKEDMKRGEKYFISVYPPEPV